jgi:hypothetical protein
MSELSDLRKDVKEIGVEVAKISGILEATLPTLATGNEVETMILEHEKACKKSREKIRRPSIPPSGNYSNYKKIGGAIGALIGLTGAIYALAQALN